MNVLLQVVLAAYVWWSLGVVNRMSHVLGFTRPSLASRMLMMAASAVVLLVVHECGHCLAGRAVGWRFLRLRIGPLGLVREAKGLRIRWIRWDLGGGATFAPTSMDGFATADLIFTAAGPLASLLGMLVFEWLAYVASTAYTFWLFSTMAQWAFLGVLSLLPAGSGLAMSDGYWLWELLRGGDQGERRQRYMLCNMAHGTAVRPRDWPGELMSPVLAGGGDRHEWYIAYVHLMDAGEPHAAFAWLLKALEKPQKSDPPEYALEAAYYLGVYRRDAKQAGKWLGSAGKDTPKWVRLRAQAAVALAWGEADRARKLVGDAERELGAAFPCGSVECERARLRDLLDRLDAGTAAIQSPHATADVRVVPAGVDVCGPS